MTKKALIVDDSRLACRVLAKMLDGFSISSTEVYSAERALEYLEHKQPDVIFLDHIMPGMNGLEMMKILKNNPTTATIPVLMYTSKEGSVYFGQARSLGAVDILPKGLDEKHLRNVLEKIGMIKEADKTSVRKTAPEKSTNDVEDLPEPRSAKLAKHATTSTQTYPDKQTKNQLQQSLKYFWFHTIEPYFEKQKEQHQKNQQYNTHLQTSKLNRELHHTLEQFEHALVMRMESHADFVASTEEISKGVRRKWFLILASLILILQMGVFWQLWHSDQLIRAQMLAQLKNSAHQQSIDEQLTQLNSSVAQLEDSTNTLPTVTEQNVSNKNDSSGAVLVDQQNEVIAELTLVNANNGLYKGITSNGYRFIVNTEGQLVKDNYQRYFLAENCVGDAYVKAPAGVILRGERERLWFVDRLAIEEPMYVNSTMTKTNRCQILSNEELNLNQLQSNMFFETGIDNNQLMHIIFK